MTDSFRDFLLGGSDPEVIQMFKDIIAADEADLASGITWGVFDGDELIETAPARYMAEAARHDIADAQDRDEADYSIREVSRAADGAR